MSTTSDRRARDFLAQADQFKLGDLVTEASHPLTANLSDVAQRSAAEGLRLLLGVDRDVIAGFRAFVDGGRVGTIAAAVLESIHHGGKVFFTGCGSTGRLSILLTAMWRHFWQSRTPNSPWEDRIVSVPAGGDYALIKAVEGFEDFTAFGRRQIADLGVSRGDIVFAITEGGETSFVIGTAWEGLEKGAKVFFVYNNPDEILRRSVDRSREVIDDARIEKINLTTGPPAISGSTRMQPTSIQLCVLSAVLETAVRSLVGHPEPEGAATDSLAALEELHAKLSSDDAIESLSQLVAMEEGAYRAGRHCTYFADHFGIDVLTDTTERSPTYCTPPFRKFDDPDAAESLAFLFVPAADPGTAWRHILKREPQCVAWSGEAVRRMVPAEAVDRTLKVLKGITAPELARFRIDLGGMRHRGLSRGDCAICVVAPTDDREFAGSRVAFARKRGAAIGIVCIGGPKPEYADATVIHIPWTPGRLLLDAMARVALKMLLNAHSTCVMVRLGRVLGNTMIWVVPSNLKLIDRSIRYVSRPAGLSYEEACRLTFEVIEHIEPRMQADQPYPPVVGLAVVRARESVSNAEAERLWHGSNGRP